MTVQEHIQEDSEEEDKKGRDKENDKKIPRYTRKEVTFTLQIYRISETHHLLEVQLNRGHPFLFLEHINKFFIKLDKAVAK